MNVWNLVKGSGVAIVSAIVLSGNSAIAINPGVTLENHLNAPTLNTEIKKHNTLGDVLKNNHSIKQTQFQNINAVGKKKTLIAGCRLYPGGCI